MQQLQFEASWDKAIAASDRQTIVRIFHDTKHLNHAELQFSPIREAINHQEALLVTALVHNYTDQPCIFNNTRLLYRVGEEVLAEELFTLPALMIPPKASMPWTFIFPKGSYRPQSSFQNGRLEL